MFVATGDAPIPDALQGTKWFVGTDFSDSSLAAVSWAKRAAGGEDKPAIDEDVRAVMDA